MLTQTCHTSRMHSLSCRYGARSLHISTVCSCLPVVYQSRLVRLSDFPIQGSYLFVEPDYSTAEARRMSKSLSLAAYGKVLLSLRKSLAKIEHTWSETNISDVVHAEMKQSGLKAKQYMTMLRHAITGVEVSPCHRQDGKLMLSVFRRRARAWWRSCVSCVTRGQWSD